MDPGETAAGAALPADQVAFIQSGVSIAVASRDAANRPSSARGVACRVSSDRRRVTVLVRPSRAESVLEDVRRCGVIAVVFSQPSTHRTIQLKGTAAMLDAVQPDDQARALQHGRDFARELDGWGFADGFAETLMDGEASDLVAVTFAPAAVYSQTPGPRAGERLP